MHLSEEKIRGRQHSLQIVAGNSGKEEMEAKTRSAEEFSIIERVARIVSSVRGTKPDYTRLAAELEQAIPFDIFGIVLLRHDRQAVRVTVCQREAGSWVALYHQHPWLDSKLAQIAQAPRLQVNDYPDGLDDVPAHSGDALSGYHQLHATLIAPLLVEDRVLGTLELGSVVPHIYADPTLQRVINAVARVLATAIESVQLGGSAAMQDRQRQALKDVTSALNAKMDLPTILNQIVVGIANALNVASGVFLRDRREGSLRLEAQSGLSHVAPDHLQRPLPVSETCILGRTLLHRQSFVSHDIICDDRFPSCNALFAALGLHSVLTYPLMRGATVYGVLFLGSPETGGFTPLKAEILALFADQATIAIHNGLLLEAVEQRRRFQEAIEQLELAHKHRTEEGAEKAQETKKEADDLSVDEMKLLAHVRAETQRTLGISFTSLLRFISDHLLTQSERGAQALFPTDEASSTMTLAQLLDAPPATSLSSPQDSFLAGNLRAQEQPAPFAETLTLLTQTTEVALTRAALLGELGRLLVQLQQSTNWVKDSWFVVDLNGICSYMNPAAEALCNQRLETASALSSGVLLPSLLARGVHPFLKIEDVFAKLLPRIRNVEEVRAYLQDFTQGSVYRQELRCCLAPEGVPLQASSYDQDARHSLRLEGATGDNYYRLTRYPLYNEQGHLEANALQVQDITEQVRDEKNRSALLSSVSHDLRTPLTTIKAAVTGLLQTDVAWEEQDRREMLEDINCETDHLTVLVNALVELSRIEMGALLLEREWCDAVEVAHGAIAKLERILSTRHIAVQSQPQLPLIYVDHAQLERVFSYLLENAVRHSPAETTIEVILDTIGDHPQMLRVQVIDYGEGIPPSEREDIFKSFYSLRSYNNGMGLAICKGIIDAHQGHIWLDPTFNKGSRFVFTLPTHPHTVIRTGGDPISYARKDVLGNQV